MMTKALIFAALFAASACLGGARTSAALEVTQPCCDNPDRVCCDGSCFPPYTNFLVPCKSNSCGCPDEPPACCAEEDRVCCNGRCFPPGTQLRQLCLSESCGCPDEEEEEEDDDEKCCAAKDRVCCDGSCFPPGTNFFAPCESDSCGCPDETPPPPDPEDDCCPIDYYCCFSRCEHISVVHVWCGPPDAPTCCEVMEGDIPPGEGTATM